jgi:YggT family protein
VLVLCNLLSVYILVLIGRAIFSWFPIGPGSALAGVYRVLLMLTEPLLTPIRRVVPPLGMFDMSMLVLLLGLEVVHGAVLGCGAGVLGI